MVGVSFLLATHSPVKSQIPFGGTRGENSGLGGKAVIAGTVHWPDGSRANRRINLTIRPQTGGDFLLSTDEDGQFVLINLTEGFYRVIIDREPDYEPVTSLVEIISGQDRLKPVYTVSLRLVDKIKLTPKPSVVKVETAGIPNKAKTFYTKALELSKAGDHRGAVEELKLAVIEDPKFMNAYNELAVQYQRLGELQKAEESALAALKIKPDAFEPLLNRGIVLFRMNRFTEADVALREVLKVNDQSAVGHFYLGRTLAKTNKYDEAESELNKAITIAPDEMKEAHRILAMLYIDKDDRAKAIASLETYLRLVPAPSDLEQLKQALAQLKLAVGKP